MSIESLSPSYRLTRRRNGKYRIKTITSTDKIIFAFLLTCVVTTLIFIFSICEYKWDMFRFDILTEMIIQFFNFASVSSFTYQEALIGIVNTIYLAVLTTIIGTLIGLVLGLFAARNISNTIVSNIVRAIASFMRAVPTIIWVLIFVPGFGLSATTAVVGMIFHTIAYFVKSFSESFEEVDAGTIEALKATGANWLQVVLNAILPVSFTKMISWIALRIETNFGVAVVVGPAVGVPGTIGSLINAYQRTGNYADLGVCVLFTFICLILFEVIITRLRQRSIVTQA